jgi:small subunit ribosomal protein S16
VKSLATKIRLRRQGAKKAPFYRVVVADSRSPRDGRCIEELGYYNPVSNPVELKIDEEKALKWLKTGAEPSETVKTLLKRTGIWQKRGE